MSERDDLKIGDHIRITSGFPFDSSHFDAEEGLPLVRIRDVQSGTTETRYAGPYVCWSISMYWSKSTDRIRGRSLPNC